MTYLIGQIQHRDKLYAGIMFIGSGPGQVDGSALMSFDAEILLAVLEQSTDKKGTTSAAVRFFSVQE